MIKYFEGLKTQYQDDMTVFVVLAILMMAITFAMTSFPRMMTGFITGASVLP